MGGDLDIEHFYRRYGPMVYRRCLQLLGDEPRAADAMQDVFVQVVRHQERLTAQAPSSLLNRIATNVCLNRRRDDRRFTREEPTALLDQIARADDFEGQVGAARFLARFFGREPASTRTIAVLHLVDGMTLEETAREVGLSVSGVRKRLRALRDRIRQIEVD